MKKYIILLCAILIFYVECDKGCEGTSASSANDCKNLNLTEADKDYCCYLHYKSDSGVAKVCTEIAKVSYDNIDEFIDDIEKDEKIVKVNGKVKKLDCNSHYLKISLLSLLLILL